MKKKIEKALEMARCAECNMDNIALRQPEVKRNPMFIIALEQLRSAINLLEGGNGELFKEIEE